MEISGTVVILIFLPLQRIGQWAGVLIKQEWNAHISFEVNEELIWK